MHDINNINIGGWHKQRCRVYIFLTVAKKCFAIKTNFNIEGTGAFPKFFLHILFV